MFHIRAFALLLIVLSGCESASSEPNREHDRAALQNADGSHTFYAGRGIGDALRDGVVIDDAYPQPFMRLQVPASLYDEAISRPTLVKTVSFEVPNLAIEATVHTFRRGSSSPVNLLFHPGDPWVTGYAQVGTGEDSFTMGFFEVIKWNKGDASGTMPDLLSSEIYTTGLLPDPDKPTLLYADDPTSVPLPDNWK